MLQPDLRLSTMYTSPNEIRSIFLAYFAQEAAVTSHINHETPNNDSSPSKTSEQAEVFRGGIFFDIFYFNLFLSFLNPSFYRNAVMAKIAIKGKMPEKGHEVDKPTRRNTTLKGRKLRQPEFKAQRTDYDP